jgi:hypothetical protein
MPNINRPRTKRDSAYRTQLDKLDDLRGSVVENGTIVECLGVYYASIEGDWMPFAPLNNESLEIGWARYDDTEFTIDNPKNFTTSEFFLPNNAQVAIDNYRLNAYNGTEFTLEDGATYALTVAFKAHLNTNNGHLSINMFCNGETDYNRIGDVIVFPKGNGIEHTFSRVFNFYVSRQAAIDGLKIKMQASHAGSIYDVIYFIEKLSHA